jgi:hypothetical protein
MKPLQYTNNSNGLFVEYHRMREGPNYFLIHYKDSSVLRQDPKDAWRVLGVAKFTDTGKDLKQWCLDIHEQYNNPSNTTCNDNPEVVEELFNRSKTE